MLKVFLFTEITFKFFCRKQKEKRVCRKFKLNDNILLNQKNFEIFWDCLPFEEDIFNDYTLMIIDNKGYGGSYSYNMPNLGNFSKYFDLNFIII